MTSVQELVAKFRSNERDIKSAGYREHQLRVEYIDPLFTLLGWDVNNAGGRPSALKDVVHEDTVRVEGRAKAPDYGFRIEGVRRFFVEAKSPLVGVADASSALQLRRYGWSANLTVSVLTDFETMAIYDCRVAPRDRDGAAHSLLMAFSCDDYISRWHDIEALVSRKAVSSGSLDHAVSERSESRGFVPVDEAFLRQIESWRNWLAQDIASQNMLSLEQLNTSIQLIIDRIIFLRIAEDRGIELHGRLLALCKSNGTYRSLVAAFRQADNRYNSGLFHFTHSPGELAAPDGVTTEIRVGDEVINKIIKGLYRPESQFEFSVMPAEILGRVYEQFLGKVVRLTTEGAVVEDKPEVKKAGGVYYTPSDVVRYMVERSLQTYLTTPPIMVSQKVGRKVERSLLRVVDPACGSGSFLIEVYQQLLDWHLDWYIQDGAEKHAAGRNPKLYKIGDNVWRLSIAEKRRILLAHIYGVDVDTQAVEVTRLSLLLKMLEGENNEALSAQMDLFHLKVLPDVAGNIRSGNSIVSTDIIPELLALANSGDEITRNNPFDWEREFAFSTQPGRFDIVVGNPPYIDSEWMTKHWPVERAYCTRSYSYASGNWDIYCVFVGRSVDLLKDNGILSFIVPNKLMTSTYAAGTRRFLGEHGAVEAIRDYSAVSVFPVAVYPIVFAFRHGVEAQPTRYEKVTRRSSAGVELEDPVYRSLAVNGDVWRIKGESLDADKFRPLGSLATICDAATVGEAYELRDLITEESHPDIKSLTVVNSGTIDRYEHLWGERSLRYLKRSLLHPVLTNKLSGGYSARRVSQGTTPKILVANMTKQIRAIYDESGSLLATKSVNVIIPKSNPWLILAILNSSYMSSFYEQSFHGRKLSGGYLQVVPATLRQLPVPNDVTKSTLDEIEGLCRQLMGAKAERRAKDGHALLLAGRVIASLEDALDRIVRGLYPPVEVIHPIAD